MEPRNERDAIEREPRRIRGLRVPLLDRLISGEAPPEGRGPYRVHDREAAVESIRREVSRMLNTRTPPGWPVFADSTVADYGIPDFSHLSAADPAACEALAKLLARKIAAFEPRLNRVRVVLTAHPTNKRRMIGAIEGYLELGLINQAVSFPLELHAGLGTATLIAPASDAV